MDMKRTSDLEGLDSKAQLEDARGTVTEDYASGPIVRDEVFGDITGKGPNYRNLGWMRASVLMVKLQIGLGVLSIVSFRLTRFPCTADIATFKSHQFSIL